MVAHHNKQKKSNVTLTHFETLGCKIIGTLIVENCQGCQTFVPKCTLQK